MSTRKEAGSQDSQILLILEGVVLFFLVFTFVLYGHQGEYVLNFLRISIAGSYGAVLFFVQNKKRRNFFRIAILVALTLLTIVLPVVQGVQERMQYVQSSEYHDGAYQSEKAFEMLLDGKNPYAESFNTEEFNELYGDIMILDGQEMLNPASESYVYLPGAFLLPGAFGYIEKALFGFRDSRLMFLIVYLLFMVFAWRMLQQKSFGPLIYFLLVFNPYNLYFLAQGRNDTFLLALLFFVFYFLQRRTYLVSFVLLGLLVALKQSTWIFAPLVLVYALMFQVAPNTRNFRRAAISAVIMCVVAALIIAPFFLWSPSDFVHDVFQYPSAGGQDGYPINGYGFSPVLLAFGFSPSSPFPFFLIMSLPATFLLVYGIREVYQHPSLWRVLMIAAFFSFWVFLFSRYFNDSHIAFIFSLFMLGAAFFLSEHREQESENMTQREV